MLALIFAFSLPAATVLADFNRPPGVDTWCGKAYRATNASFDPGGWLDEPVRSPDSDSEPGVRLRAYPRMNVYVEGDAAGGFVVDAVASQDWAGEEGGLGTGLEVKIKVTETGQLHVYDQQIVVGTTGNEFSFSLDGLPASLAPHEVTVTASAPDGSQAYSTSTQIYKLPARSDSGSIVKLDNLYGGLWIQDRDDWVPFFPFSYYISWGGWLNTSPDRLNEIQAAGYNMVHIVPDCGAENHAFDFTELTPFLDRCDELGLYIQYDMRCTYQNGTMLSYQLDLLGKHKSLLLWYTSDEPDGNEEPLNATAIAYRNIKAADPYHPVSLVLNCYNYYYKEYTAGADIVMTDVYPISTHTTWSTVYNTPCNATYGCCGCDDCIGAFEDVSIRLERYKQYQDWLDAGPKSFWATPQAFGNESFWMRYPTGQEVIVMSMLAINHGAKGIVSWIWPTTDDISNATSALAKALTKDDIMELLLGNNPTPANVTGVHRVDAAIWKGDDPMLVSIVNLERAEEHERIEIGLPATEMERSVSVIWGGEGWTVKGNKLVKTGLQPLETSLLLVELDGQERGDHVSAMHDEV